MILHPSKRAGTFYDAIKVHCIGIVGSESETISKLSKKGVHTFVTASKSIFSTWKHLQTICYFQFNQHRKQKQKRKLRELPKKDETRRPTLVVCLVQNKHVFIAVWNATKRWLFLFKNLNSHFLIQNHNHNRTLSLYRFSFQKTKTNILLVCNLLLGQNSRDPECMSFSQVLHNSLSVEKTTPAYCETCKKFTPTNQFAHVTELPQILSINCGLKNEKEMNFLKRQLNRNAGANVAGDVTVTPASTSTPIKPCRYGTNCSRVDCHFAHSDRKSPATNNYTNNSSAPAQTTGNPRSNIWFPHHFTMEIDSENDLKINSTIDSNENSTLSSKSVDKTLEELNVNDLSISGEGDSGATTSTAPNAIKQRKSYQLTAVVCQIVNGNQKSLVALVLVGNQYHRAKIADYDPANDGQWYIFNDFR